MLISLQQASSFLSDHHDVFDEMWRHREVGSHTETSFRPWVFYSIALNVTGQSSSPGPLTAIRRAIQVVLP